MRRRHLHLIAASALAAGAIAAGCGDDDDDSSLSKDEFIAQANEICAQGTTDLNEAAEAEFGAGGQPTPEEEQAFVTDTVVPNIQGQIDEIRDIVPEDEADEVNEILDKAELAVQDLEEDPTSVQGGDDPFAEVNDELVSYGLSSCGGG
jgi:hypothetical protein